LKEHKEDHNPTARDRPKLLTWDHRVGSISLVTLGSALGFSQYFETSGNHLDFFMRTGYFALLGFALYKLRWWYQAKYSRTEDIEEMEHCRINIIAYYQLTNLLLGVTGSMIGAGITGFLFY
jgi:hypothetical protein